MCIRVHSPEMKYTKRSAIGCIFQCSFTGNEMYKTKVPLFASKEKHVGKKQYLFLHKDFDRSKKLSKFTFNGQNFFFWLTPCTFTFTLTQPTYPPPVLHTDKSILYKLFRGRYIQYRIHLDPGSSFLFAARTVNPERRTCLTCAYKYHGNNQ